MNHIEIRKYIDICLFSEHLKKATKKVLFFVARPLTFNPPPPGLAAIGTFFLPLKKFFFP